MAKKALGKGLGAIITDSSTPVGDIEQNIARSDHTIIELDINSINPNPDQPRESFNKEELKELADSIGNAGLLQPIIVRKDKNKYYVIAGERRLRASKLAGLGTIKAIVIQATEEENLTFALIENIQRKNLDPIEEAKAYRVLISRFKLKQQDVAERVGRDRATIANLMRLLNLPESIQRAVGEGTISVGHAKLLLSVSEEEQHDIFEELLKKDLSVRSLEELIEQSKSGKGKNKNKDAFAKDPKNKDAHLKKMEDMLLSRLGTKVEIKNNGTRGKIEIYYYSLDDFERILEILS